MQLHLFQHGRRIFNERGTCPAVLPALCSFGVLLAGCGGGGGNGATGQVAALPQTTLNQALTTPDPKGALAQSAVQLTYLLPDRATSSARRQSASLRRAEYVSTSNTQLTVMVTPVGGSPATYGPTACTIGSCTVTFTANPGPNTLAFTLTDGSNNLLSSFSTVVIIQPTPVTTLKFTANPVVHSVALSLASASLNGGTSASDLLTVAALDSDGNTIVGSTPYVDVNGNPVSFLLNVVNDQVGGAGTVTIQGPLRIAAPAQSAIYARYDGRWLADSTISVTSTSSAITSFTSAMVTIMPTVYEYATPTAGSGPWGIASGPDGNLWVTESSLHQILKFSTSGSGLAEYPELTSGGATYGITNGPDGNLWFAENGANNGAKVSTSGAVSEYGIGNTPTEVAPGPAGNLWFTLSGANRIARVSTTGTATTFTALTANSQPFGIARGSDGNMWFTELAAGQIGRITPTGQITEYPIPSGTSSKPTGIVLGPDGNMWFAEAGTGSNAIGVITPSGSVMEHAVLSASSSPENIGVGPDGNIWFTEKLSNKIGMMTLSGVPTEYSVSGSPRMITTGPDGNIWFVDNGANKVGRLVR